MCSKAIKTYFVDVDEEYVLYRDRDGAPCDVDYQYDCMVVVSHSYRAAIRKFLAAYPRYMHEEVNYRLATPLEAELLEA